MGGQLNLDKCHIGGSRVTLVGHVVSKIGIEANLGKILKGCTSNHVNVPCELSRRGILIAKFETN